MSNYIAYAPETREFRGTHIALEGRWEFQFFDTLEEATTYKLSNDRVKILDNTSGFLNGVFDFANDARRAEEHFRGSKVRLKGDVIDALLDVVSDTGWTSEETISRAISLTRFEWEALIRDTRFSAAQRKRGYAFRLTKEGATAKGELEDRREWEAELAKRAQAREARNREHERIMAETERFLAERGIAGA